MGKFTGKNGTQDRENLDKFERNSDGFKKSSKFSKDKKLKHGLRKVNDQYKQAVRSAAATEMLLQEDAGFLEAEGMERTFKFKQSDIKKEVDQTTSNKAFDLKLNEFGPYTLDYSRNGTHLLIGGMKGHVAAMDWRKGALSAELHLGETINAVKYLQNEQYFAVAQKKYTFIYDHEGTELHRMKQHIDVKHLDFLPYHYLLVTGGNTGFIKYQDVSTGLLVNEIRTKMGPTTAMKQNPYNAIMHCGNSTGVVSLYSPAANEPLVKLQSCRGPVKDIAVDRSGHYMAVAGADKTLKIWDIRNFKELYSYYTPTPASSLDISDGGLLSVSWGPHVTVWKDPFKTKQNSPYMNHLIPGSQIQTIKSVPYEDFLGVGHQSGVSNLIVPGSGEANFDALEVNPYETAKQRQESEVRSLLQKLPADSISLDPNVIGTVDKRSSQQRLKPSDLNELSKKPNQDDKTEPRPDVKSKNSALRRHLRKKASNVIDQRKLRIEANLKREKELRAKKLSQNRGEPEEKELLGPALSRFK
ncbi:U3 small nucleolar RNA-associated protein [Wickerhamomyces ciferrii]|uniref:U three protein 7 n=1 Tax=Wickerhamomyces ciferrii (strain ATCC 14091 / BCRC 22168 / CBS 111 / JCM 3599 / NBRC 0793 / NRRL Y-1031 F-60-10) TaxID=1206466 RepID=K0KQ63_WICCF|nr:U3 small nucleolar RNA-associated protein [Wickerhamomyces ciferrii]CCH43348.1 U3 small nucleolar RNA-associated protein [Wickerhamomyces ciferrii]